MSARNILIVEDEAIVAEDLASKVRKLGYEVIGITAEGEEAVSMAARLHPDLVLMDIELEGKIDGIEAAERIRHRCYSPIIYLTAHSDSTTLARAKLTGPLGYILKPFEERELAVQIETALYRHQADREVREHREWLQVTLNSIGDAVIATDASAHITFINPVAEMLTGWKAAETMGMPVSQVFRVVDEQSGMPGEDIVSIALREARVVPLQANSALIKKDGRAVPVEDSTAPIKDAAGELIGAVLVFRDVSEKRKTETQLRQAQKMEAIGRLAGGIAHEFNNMLNVIIGYADLINFQLDENSKLNPYVREIQQAARRSSKMTDQLLAYSRKQTTQPEVIEINEALKNQIQLLDRLIQENVEIRFEPGDNIWPVKMDPYQLDQILYNLANNARDAIPASGHLIIRTENIQISKSNASTDLPPGEYVCLTFADNGIGMDENTLKKIFDPYFSTKEVGKGTGLGMSMVYGIVKQNEGAIFVDSKPNSGTTVRIYLPKEKPENEKEARTFSETKSDVSQKTVLIVEDEPQVLDLAELILTESGYRVLKAKAPSEAIDIAQKNKASIDLLVSDVIMPEMNGGELHKQIEKIHPGIRTLFMSGYSAEILAGKELERHAENFLSKPFTPQTLAEKVDEIMG